MASVAPTTGNLHNGNNVGPATTKDAPGTLHTGAPPAKRGGIGMFGGHKNGDSGMTSDGGRGGGFKVNSKARICLLISQILTLLAFIITLGGLSALQKQANSLALPAATQLVYTDQFQSAGQTPYPTDGPKQFGLQWWILIFELVIFIIVLALTAFPRYLLRLKHVAMAFLVYVFVLVTLQVNSLLWFNRSAIAQSVFGSHRIKATLAGALLACICNAFSIIFLGLLRDDSHHHGIGGKRVGHDSVGHSAV